VVQFDRMSSTRRTAVVIGRDEVAAEQLVRNVRGQSQLVLLFAMGDQRRLAKRLREVSTLPVIEVHKPVELETEHIYVLPKDRLVTVDNHRLVVGPPNGPPSRDHLLRSLADSYGADSAAVILGGSGADGVLGTKRIKEAGGITICQLVANEAATELPRLASASGMIDLALAPADIGARLSLGDPELTLTEPDAALTDIITMVSALTGHDFHAHKLDGLYRRLVRRMQLHHIGTLAEYHRFLREHPLEVKQLFRDFLIGISDFFRDPDAFAALEREVIAELFEGKRRTDHVRVWVAGCATGEEAYSIGMLLCEHADELPEAPAIEVFASDVDPEALREARAGSYPRAISADVSAERLRRFFCDELDQFSVGATLKRITLFSKHDILRDPPFSRIDLVCCRNVLVHLSARARQQALEVFHYALRPRGYLFVSPADDVDSPGFEPVTQPHIYMRKNIPERAMADEGRFSELHQRLVEQYAPASLLIDDNLDVVHATPHASAYVQQRDVADRHVLHVVHPQLCSPLREAISAVRQTSHGTSTRLVQFSDGGVERTVLLRVHARQAPSDAQQVLLVVFDELDNAA
jgi:two-component system CheB/CheR fusion protein